MKNKSIKEILLYLSLIFIMVMSLNLAAADCTGMELSLAKMILFTLTTIVGMSIIIVFPISLLVVLIIGLGVLFYSYYKNPEMIMHYMHKVPEFYRWLYGYILGYDYFEPDYSLVFGILYILMVTFVVSIIVYSGRGSFALILFGTAAMSFFWFIYVEKARLYLVVFLFAAIMLYSYQVYRKRLKEWRAADSCVEYNVGRNWLLCSAGVIIISLVLSLTIPLDIEPVRWSWLNDKAVSLFPFIGEWRNDSLESFSYGYNSRFTLNSIGYINKKLGGELRQDASVLMTVKTRGEDTLYLRGSVKDKYFQNNWYKSSKGLKEYRPGNSIPLPYSDSVDTYEKTLDITYMKLLTSTIFAPYSVYEVNHDSKRIYVDEDSEVYTSKMIMKDESYIVKSRMPYIDVNKLRLAKALNLDANDYKLYTSLAPDISSRVRTLAREITKEHANNYDKAKAVEKHLRQNYQYYLEPPVLPSEAEFTDHFLFEGRKGYCTYFATSMAVLLRAADIPCRYVEGFIARYDGASVREIKGTDAHAWVEVYFDDFGWVFFEPTPHYPAVEFRSAPETVEELNIDTETNITLRNFNVPNMPDRRSAMEEHLAGGIGAEYTGDEKSTFSIGKSFLFMLISLLILRFLFMYCIWIIKEFSLGRCKGRSFSKAYIKYVLWYFKRAGIEMEQDETLREFFKKVRHRYEERFSDVSNITVILEKIRYGNKDLAAEDKKALEVFRKEAKKLALNEAGTMQLFISLYILGR